MKRHAASPERIKELAARAAAGLDLFAGPPIGGTTLSPAEELLQTLQVALATVCKHDEACRSEPHHLVSRSEIAHLIGCHESTLVRHVRLPDPVPWDSRHDRPRGQYVYLWSEVRPVVLHRVLKQIVARYWAFIETP